MDSRVNILKAAFDHQHDNRFDFPVYIGREQYGHGFSFLVFMVTYKPELDLVMCSEAFGDSLGPLPRQVSRPC